MTSDCTLIARQILSGATLLYPTDTIWGIGCDATNAQAIERLYAIKQRDHSKSMLILVSDEAMLRRYIPSPSPEALQLLTSSNRPTTVIFPVRDNTSIEAAGTMKNNPLCQAEEGSETANAILPDNLLAADGTIGVRIPKHTFCQELIRHLDRPLVSTSANLSGQPSPANFDQISPQLKQMVDLITDPIYDEQDGTSNKSSRILKVTPTGILVLRD